MSTKTMQSNHTCYNKCQQNGNTQSCKSRQRTVGKILSQLFARQSSSAIAILFCHLFLSFTPVHAESNVPSTLREKLDSEPIKIWTEQQTQSNIDRVKRWPKIMLMPWQTTNVDPATVQAGERYLALASNTLSAIMMEDGKKIEQSNPEEINRSLNRSMRNILRSDKLKYNFGPGHPYVAVYPIWSRIQSRDVMALLTTNSLTNEMIALSHVVLKDGTMPLTAVTRSPKKPLLQANAGTESKLTAVINQLWSQQQQQLESKKTSLVPAQFDLAIGVSEINGSDRSDEVDRILLSSIMLEQCCSQFARINAIGTEQLMALQSAFGLKDTLRRPNRQLTVSWIYPQQNIKSPSLKILPIHLQLSIRSSDAVFAKTLPWQINEKVVIDVKKPDDPQQQGPEQIVVAITKQLPEKLSIEFASLKRSEAPTIAKIYGAWAYLDKGRAWGLRMNDRLVIADGTDTVKGHIVGYFGPEAGLKSPRGYPIHEGAIMFVRKGQAKTALGQEMTYDKMLVPTKWPPKYDNVK
jgi:hypothetical protein